MSIQDVKEAINLIEEYGGDFEGEKEITLLNRAEQALGLKFPPTYKRFLQSLGCGDIEGAEFYGVIKDDFENSSVPDAIWLTLDERKSGLPDNLIIIYSSGDGAYFALDANQINDDGEYPVVNYQRNGDLNQVAEDFGSFLLSELNSILEL